MNPAGLVDLGSRRVERLLGAGQLGLQRVRRRRLGVQPGLQLLARGQITPDAFVDQEW